MAPPRWVVETPAPAPAASENPAPAPADQSVPEEKDALPAYTKNLQFNIVGGENSLQSQSLAKFAELVKEKTNGNITIECFFSAQLADNKTAPIMVSDGSIDMTSGCGTSWMSDYVPALGFATASYVFASGEHWQAVFGSDLFGDLVKQFEDKLGVKVLGFQYLGERNVVSNKPASTPEEFAAINMRVPTTQAYLDAGLELIEPDISVFMNRAAEIIYPNYEKTWGKGTIDAARALAP